MDPLTMFSCPFRHDTTLQQHRLLSITANVTSWGAARTSQNAQYANFVERRQREVRLCPGPMGGDFSGSSTVASRNTLLHDGATNATWSGHFYPEAVPP